jgi:hypothetical protein
MLLTIGDDGENSSVSLERNLKNSSVSELFLGGELQGGVRALSDRCGPDANRLLCNGLTPIIHAR